MKEYIVVENGRKLIVKAKNKKEVEIMVQKEPYNFTKGNFKIFYNYRKVFS